MGATKARANRLANADHANLVRTSRAAQEQIRAVGGSRRRGGLGALPPKLREIAEAAASPPLAVSLRELAVEMQSACDEVCGATAPREPRPARRVVGPSTECAILDFAAGLCSSGDGFRPRPSPRSGARFNGRGRSSSELPLRPAAFIRRTLPCSLTLAASRLRCSGGGPVGLKDGRAGRARTASRSSSQDGDDATRHRVGSAGGISRPDTSQCLAPRRWLKRSARRYDCPNPTVSGHVPGPGTWDMASGHLAR